MANMLKKIIKGVVVGCAFLATQQANAQSEPKGAELQGHCVNGAPTVMNVYSGKEVIKGDPLEGTSDVTVWNGVNYHFGGKSAQRVKNRFNEIAGQTVAIDQADNSRIELSDMSDAQKEALRGFAADAVKQCQNVTRGGFFTAADDKKAKALVNSF